MAGISWINVGIAMPFLPPILDGWKTNHFQPFMVIFMRDGAIDIAIPTLLLLKMDIYSWFSH